jgi:vacuolar protein sorting-associated protein 13A/C
MIEQAFNWILNTFFHRYIENSESYEEKFRLGILSGNFILQNLRFKPSILDVLHLPIQLKVFTIGQIKVEVPWTSLGSSPLLIAIDDVSILLQPNFEVDASSILKEETRKKSERVRK